MHYRRQQILDFMSAYQKEHGYPPSYHTIGEHFGIQSKSTVWWHVRQLVEAGDIEMIPRTRASGQYVLKYRPPVTL